MVEWHKSIDKNVISFNHHYHHHRHFTAVNSKYFRKDALNIKIVYKEVAEINCYSSRWWRKVYLRQENFVALN